MIIMRLIFSLVLTVIQIFCITISTSHSLGEGEGDDLNHAHCIKREEEALLRFKEGFSSPSSSNPLSSWDPTTDCCKWRGIGCDNTTGHVISLNLRSLSSSDTLSGSLNSSLLDLPYLNSLDVSGNNLMQNEVPKFLGSLHNLEHLNLSSTNIRGTLPYQLGNLSCLQSLDLSDNRFYLVVSNLDWLNGLSSLRELDLSEVLLGNAQNWLDVINALPFLVELRLQACKLPQLPSALPYVNFTSLQTLDLSSNDFYGTIPDWLFEIRHIQNFNLSDNELYGHIPNKFENLNSLVTLDLSNNNISGLVPSTLGKGHSQNKHVRRSSMKELYLSSNRLWGRLEESLVRFSSLEVLDVSENDLEGIIMDTHLDNLRSLRVLDLSSNRLSLNVRKNWTPPFQLETIGLRSIHVGHQFPIWLQSQKNFIYLDVSNANISGFVPDWFWHLSPNVKHLKLSGNNLRGCVHDLSLNFNLHTLDLRGNKFHCPLPHFPSTIRKLILAENSFYGLMSTVCEILSVNNSLINLDLSSNNLSGEIPNCWEHGKSLIFLNLGNNFLSGHIPDSFGSLDSLVMLYLQFNNLFGKIPTSLQKCTNLIYLTLYKNRLSGEIPIWIGDSLQHLMVLMLGSNALEGNIPWQLCQLNLLKILDLSENHLSGAIPRSCVFTAMATKNPMSAVAVDPYDTFRKSFMTLYLGSGINWHLNKRYFDQHYYPLQQINFQVKILDLSSNSLTGEIPKEIARHVGLHVLNLSRNQLMGSIPFEIGNLTEMEHLDLSHNRLSCSIPTSMSNMDLLSFLDLSYNNLAGKIPFCTQFQTFDANSFQGNVNLCGAPLPKSCPTNKLLEDQHCKHSEEHKGIAEHEGQENDNMNWLETPSFCISMVLGFITGIWAFWGPLILNKSWRHSYFRFLGHVANNICVTVVVSAAKLQRSYHGE